jgi:hypothetical protein
LTSGKSDGIPSLESCEISVYIDLYRVILVPDASISTVVTLEESRWAWLSSITRQASVTAKYYEYVYSHKSKDGSVWQDLSDSGDNLLTHLLALDSQAQVNDSSHVLRRH